MGLPRQPSSGTPWVSRIKEWDRQKKASLAKAKAEAKNPGRYWHFGKKADDRTAGTAA